MNSDHPLVPGQSNLFQEHSGHTDQKKPPVNS